jgi:hypothetical protein
MLIFVLAASGIAFILMKSGDFTSDIITERFQYDQELGMEKENGRAPADGRLIYEKKREEPYVGTFTGWFVEPFSGFGESSGTLLSTVKKYGAILFIPLTLIVIVWYIRRKKKTIRKENDDKETITSKKVENHEPYSTETVIATHEQLHKIRGLLKSWESNLNTIDRKRESETIREWFQRIKGPIDIIPIYEKVRYGKEECTKEEYITVIKKLK